MKITVNGVEYTSWEQMPPEVRAALSQALPDADGDGVPDLLQGGSALDALRGLGEGSITTSVSSYTVDGTEYSSASELPERVRRALEQAGVLPPDAATAPLGTPVAPPEAPAAPRQTMLNGEPFDPSAEPKRKRWWQLGH
ncbi:hypothetical protein [Nocardioides limicola]|uniref:hypothetical protein n=1 Tax=Nocardioides limicola TaxID=2803368 RepID=UPI00193C7B30|nr:hypothetical protein [Nocardioides sp. DJM-14]